MTPGPGTGVGVKRFGLSALLCGVASLVMPRTAAAVATTVTYDFQGVTSTSTGHQAFWDKSSAFTTTTTPATLAAGENAELATANYREIDADDAVNTGNLNADNLQRHFRFELVLTHKVTAITQIAAFWIGGAETAVTQTLYVWNEVTLTWEPLGSHAATVDTEIVGTPISAGFANYIDAGGVLQLCVVAAAPGGGAPRDFRTDYVRIVVSADTTLPSPPASLAQFRADGTTPIALGGTTPESQIIAKATATDADTDTVRLAVEIKPVGTAFTGTATATGSLVASGGTAQANPRSLVTGNYHWQAWVIDQNGGESTKVSFGGNPESATDVRVEIPTTFYYVATTGVNTPCTLARENDLASPFLSPQGAFNCLKTNHTNDITGLGAFVIQIQDSGTYGQIDISGLTTTATDSLTLRAAAGQTPTLDSKSTQGGSAGTAPAVVINGMGFTTVSGLRFINTNAEALTGFARESMTEIGSGTNVTFSDCTWDGTTRITSVSDTISMETGASTGTRFLRCRFDTSGGDLVGHAAGGGTPGATVYESCVFTRWGDKTALNGLYMRDGGAGSVIRNCTFDNNSARGGAHGFFNGAGVAVTLVNDLFTNITGAGSFGIAGARGGSTLDYSLYFGNTGDVDTAAGWAKGANDLSAVDPLYVSQATGDLHLRSSAGRVTNAAPGTFTNDAGTTCSRAIDSGDPASAWQTERFDNGMRVNRGAYGNTSQASKSCACLEPLGDATLDLNGTRTAARVCPLVTTVGESGAEASAADTTDFYFFNASVAGPYTFDVTITSPALFDLFLYDAAGGLLASNAPGGVCPVAAGQTRSVTFTLPEALHYVEVRYVCGTSTYTLTTTASAPLSSSVLGVRAEAIDAFVRVSWETDLDSDALAFRVLRSEQGNTSTVGPDPLPVEIAGAGSYVQDDLDVTCGVRYEYSLEEQSPDGVLVHGPISVTACEAAGVDQDPGRGCAILLASSRPPASPLGFAVVAALAVLAALAARPRSA